MTRAALLPAGSDPFLLAYWLRNFATWSQYVDELHVAVCGTIEPEPMAYMESLIASTPGATLYHIEKRTDHGMVIGYLVDKTSADTVMLCEDDAFVRRPEVVDQCFRHAEEGGIAATTREGYASASVVAASTAAYGKSYAFWPCFLFVAREHLLATDRHFGGRNWAKGEFVAGRELMAPASGDTMVSASYQLHALRLHEKLLNNHRLSGQTVPDDAPWFHIGSLSGGHGQMFMSDIGPEEYAALIEHYKVAGDVLQRVAWWWRAWDRSRGAIPDYHARYLGALTGFMHDIGIQQHNVDWYHQRAEGLVNWAER